MAIKRKLTGRKESLNYFVFENREEMGKAAAIDAAEQIVGLQQKQDEIRMVFAAAPSQNEFLNHLVQDQRIEWERITAFHMDEYLGLDEGAPQLFQNFLKRRLFDLVPFKQVHLINSSNMNECERYSELLKEKPIDIVCLGIGENGHLAFNDPPVADFNDKKTIKKVKLDEACKQQQVNDGCFDSLSMVPEYALTLTLPALMAARAMYCVVPGSTKQNAVNETLNGPISTACPATILRTHPNAFLYLDHDSYGALDNGE